MENRTISDQRSARSLIGYFAVSRKIISTESAFAPSHRWREIRQAAVRSMVLITALSACPGYTLVKNSDLKRAPVTETVVVIDSTAVMMLRQQLASLQARYRTDSIKAADIKRLNVSQDSVIKLRSQEIDNLKEQLAKATDELERIKRRLANPRS